MRGNFLAAAMMLGLVHIGMAEQSVFQQGTDGYTGAVDGVLDGGNENVSTQSFWQVDRLNISGVPWGGAKRPALLRFDGIFGTGPKQVPPDAMIVSARLELYKLPSDQEASYDSNAESAAEANRNLRFFFLRTPFFAEPGNGAKGYSCYSFREFGTESRRWGKDATDAAAGPVKEEDYETTRVGALPIESGTKNQWYEADLTTAVKRWSAGESNHGLYLYTGGFWLGAEYASSDYPDEKLRPRLIIEWSK